MEEIFDLAIIGGGASGMTAAIYAKRLGLNVIIFEKNMPGGVIASSFEIENFPGFSKIKGTDLALKMFQQVQSLDINFEFEEIKETDFSKNIKILKTSTETFFAKTVLLDQGTIIRTLNIENEEKFIGRGISFCATCDGNFFKDKIVAVVGGSNSALKNALYLSNLAQKVFLIHRREEFRGESVLIERIKKTFNIELILNSVTRSLIGDDCLKKIEVFNHQTNEKKLLEVSGLFVCIGQIPNTKIVDKNIEKDLNGYIVTDEKMQTNTKGVYAAGDVRNTPLRQIITACSDGAIAATNILNYIKIKYKR